MDVSSRSQPRFPPTDISLARSRSLSRQRRRDGIDQDLDGSTDSDQDRRKLARRGLRIGRTSVGKGVFATKRIPFATCIGEIEGVIHDYSEWESRYSFDLEDGRQLEPIAPFRFVNHSCEPNCNFQVVDFNDQIPMSIPDPRILLYASYEIRVGEELTIDYNWPLDFAIRCRCKSTHCRGWIVDPAQLGNIDTASGQT